jgi:hypothetical protein
MSKLNNEFDSFEMIHTHLRPLLSYKIFCIKMIHLLIQFFPQKN